MSPHSDLAAPARWRRPLRAVAVAAIASMLLSGGAAAATLKVGSHGSAVKQVQRKLGVPTTGYYGTQTKAAVKRCQRSHRLHVDGVAGPATLRALGVHVRSASYSTGGTSPAPASSSQGSNVKVPAVLKRIAQCESGGNPRAVSPSGQYRGKYQFDRATWRRWGGTGDPAAAPEAVQDRIALKLYRARGTAPWPNCA
jgi:resuscitation-promoting factor RpfB